RLLISLFQHPFSAQPDNRKMFHLPAPEFWLHPESMPLHCCLPAQQETHKEVMFSSSSPQTRSLRVSSSSSTSLSALMMISCSILTFILIVIGSLGAATSIRGVQAASIKDDVNAASKIFIVFPHTLFLADSHFPADVRSAPTMPGDYRQSVNCATA